MNLADLSPGQLVTWKYEPRGGYGYTIPVAARVLKVGKQRVQIEVVTKDNQHKRVSVFPDRLVTAQERDTAADALRARAVATKMATIRAQLGTYRFTANNEDELQRAVAKVLALPDVVAHVGMTVDREVRASFGRYDILLTSPRSVRWTVVASEMYTPEDDIQIVLELKVKSSAAAVERQSQRYAMTPGIAAVMLVTTDGRLASQVPAGTLGGKPFGVIALRTAF